MSSKYKNKISKGRKRFYAQGGVHNWTGKSLSEETKRLIAQKAIGNKRRKGFKNTKEHNEILRKASLGNKRGLKHGLSKTREYANLKAIKARLRKLNFSIEEYQDLLKRQKNRCKICGTRASDRRLHLDHCHKTNKVRGFLCGPCNMALGLLRDDISTLKKAVKFLEHAKMAM